MQTVNTQFEQELTKLIDAEIDRLTGNMIFGGAVADYAAYTALRGQILGLQLAKDQFGEVNRIIAER